MEGCAGCRGGCRGRMGAQGARAVRGIREHSSPRGGGRECREQIGTQESEAVGAQGPGAGGRVLGAGRRSLMGWVKWVRREHKGQESMEMHRNGMGGFRTSCKNGIQIL